MIPSSGSIDILQKSCFCFCCIYSFASGCMALPVLMNIKQVIEQRQCSGVWTHKDELPVMNSLFVFLFMGDLTLGLSHQVI